MALRLLCLFLIPFHPPLYLSVSKMNSETQPRLLSVGKNGFGITVYESFVCFLLWRPQNFPQQLSDQLYSVQCIACRRQDEVGVEKGCEVWVLLHNGFMDNWDHINASVPPEQKVQVFSFWTGCGFGQLGMVGVAPGFQSPQLNFQPLQADSVDRSWHFRLSRKTVFSFAFLFFSFFFLSWNSHLDT